MTHTQICFAEFVKRHLNFELDLLESNMKIGTQSFKYACDSTKKLHFWKETVKSSFQIHTSKNICVRTICKHEESEIT